jgi:hypothetical protein
VNIDRDKQPRRGAWPYPGDSPVVRARRVAQMYRSQLNALNPGTCGELDRTAAGFGEGWVVERLVTHADDDLLPPADAAEFLCISVDSLGALRRRGRLTGYQVDGGWVYQFADLRALSERRPRTTSR